jgi:hypothetical protein
LFWNAEDLTKLRRNFSLSEEESLGVEVDEQGMHEIGSRGKACMVCKLFSDRLIGKDAIRSTLVRAWRPEGTLVFKALGDNIFLLEFEHFWEKDRVKEGQPWVFEGNLISIADYNGSIPPAQMDFEKVSFWARMLNLPLSCMSATMGHQIGKSVGIVEDVETEDDGVSPSEEAEADGVPVAEKKRVAMVSDFRVMRLTLLESLLLRRNVLAVLRESREIKLMELFLLKRWVMLV